MRVAYNAGMFVLYQKMVNDKTILVLKKLTKLNSPCFIYFCPTSAITGNADFLWKAIFISQTIARRLLPLFCRDIVSLCNNSFLMLQGKHK